MDVRKHAPPADAPQPTRVGMRLGARPNELQRGWRILLRVRDHKKLSAPLHRDR